MRPSRLRPVRLPAVAALAALVVSAGALAGPASAALSGPAPAGQGTTLYVSPRGSDAGSGTSPARAVRTLARAQQLVRAMDQDMTGDITVELMSGTYRLSQPLTLDASDSGTNGYNVIWTAAPGARPVVSGVALYMPYRNRASGQNSLPVCVYDASVPLQAGQPVARIILPDTGAGVVSGSPSLHIFAVTIG